MTTKTENGDNRTQTHEVSLSSFQRADDIFRRGTDFLHHKLTADALKINLRTPPEIPFTTSELLLAHSRGEQLIWFPAKDAKGAPITMKRIHDSFKNVAPIGGKLLYDIDWYKNEKFFIADTARSDKSGLGQWRLVGQQAVPNTKGENYLQQTIIAADYVAETIYGGNPPEELKSILAEPKARQDEIAELMNKDWQKAAEILAALPFNQMFRESPIEAMTRVIINQSVNKIRLLKDEYSWTNVRSSFGNLVSFGYAGKGGASVSFWSPQDASGLIGFFLSRSEIAGSES